MGKSNRCNSAVVLASAALTLWSSNPNKNPPWQLSSPITSLTLQTRSFASLICVNALGASHDLNAAPRPQGCFSLESSARPPSCASRVLQRVKSSLKNARDHFPLLLLLGFVVHGPVLFSSPWARRKSFASCLYLPVLQFISDLEIFPSFPCSNFWSPVLLLF